MSDDQSIAKVRRAERAFDNAKFKKNFDEKSKKMSIKALDVLYGIATNGRAEMARVAAAKAIIEKAVPQESLVNIDVHHTNYADTLRELAAIMRPQEPMLIEVTPTIANIADARE